MRYTTVTKYFLVIAKFKPKLGHKPMGNKRYVLYNIELLKNEKIQQKYVGRMKEYVENSKHKYTEE